MITNAVYREGVAYSPDGAVYVQHTDGATMANPIFTGTGGSGYPIILAQSFAAVSGAADTNENTLATITVPANALGANGHLRIRTFWAATGNGNVKTLRVRYSGASGTEYLAWAVSTQTPFWVDTSIANRNATNSQFGSSIQHNSGSLGTVTATSTVDTTAATTIVVTGQKATGTDALTLEGYCVEIIKP